ncbi:MAG TPA: chorismate-binding protein [Mariprofundaceae bacterium]|nr:chorismate-binding protein [Mariprofundaceae bacterium]
MRCLLYASYEAGNLLEKLPKPAAQPAGSVFSAFFPDFSVCFDADISVMHLAAKSQDQLDQLLSLIDGEPQKPDTKNIDISHEDINVTSSKEYKNSVRNVREYIASGDIFQANIARFWHANLDADLLPSLYDMLRRVNPAPFSCMARIESKRGVMHLLSASPERLFRMLPDGEVDTRPIAGTRRRGEGDADEILSAELLLSEKERAEHIMLVDLERNDLGRVCQPGSVEVNERMAIERYATVQHIVSNVRGKLAEGRDVIDVFRAMFPGGTITGCPKIRCMEIIHELEQRPRGPYTGSIGYVAWDGSADMNILIRTFWHHDGQLHWAAGAGIVADSDPEHELIETEHKAEGLMRALFTKK